MLIKEYNLHKVDMIKIIDVQGKGTITKTRDPPCTYT